MDQSRCVALWRCVLLGGAGIPRVVEVVVVWHKGEIGEREGKEEREKNERSECTNTEDERRPGMLPGVYISSVVIIRRG